MSAVVIQCPHCEMKAKIATESLGRSVRCRKCSQLYTAASSANSQQIKATPHNSARETANSRRSAPQAVSSQLPKEIGGFPVQRLLGQGAFGQVFLGFDPKLERWLALKVPHVHTLSSAKAQKRFEREAKAAAQLRHPHIVPIYAAGFDGQFHFIAAQFIASPIQPAEGPPSVTLTLEEYIQPARLNHCRITQIVRDLAEALAHAHSLGIIHRDVKPANVLIGADDTIYLADFGLAHLPDSQEKLTHEGAVLGTPLYMAPEVAQGIQGRAEPACDQYSLGIVLYEMLCGKPPFEGPPTMVLSMHVNNEPPAPRSIHPGIPKDLETICLKAIAKTPKDRYENCQAMADDLRRWLEGEPIHARRLTIREQFVRWCRRKPGTAAFVILFFLTLITGIGFSTYFAIESSYHAAESEKSFLETQQVIDKFLTKMGDEDMKDLPGMQQFRQELVAKAVLQYEKFLKRRPNDVHVLEAYAKALMAEGTIEGEVGSAKSATESLVKAINIQKDLTKMNPNMIKYQFQLARSQLRLAKVHWSARQYQKAKPHLDKSIYMLEKIVKQPTPELQQQLILGNAYNTLGNVLRGYNTQASFLAYQKSHNLVQKLCEENPDNYECLAYFSQPLGNLSMIYNNKGELTKALQLENSAIKVYEAALKRFPNAPSTLANRGIGYGNKGLILARLDQIDESFKCYQEAVTAHRKVTEQNPLVGRYRRLFVGSLSSLAFELRRRKKYTEANDTYQKAIAIMEKQVDRVDAQAIDGAVLLQQWLNLAAFYKGTLDSKSDNTIREKKRLHYLNLTQEKGEKLVSRFPNASVVHYEIVRIHDSFAEFANSKKQTEEAFAHYQKMIDVFLNRVCANNYRPSDYQIGRFLVSALNATKTAHRLKKSDQVLSIADQAYEIGKNCSHRNGIQSLGAILEIAGKIHQKTRNHKQAVAYFTKELHICTPIFEKNPWHWYLRNIVAKGNEKLGEVYMQMGDYHKAVVAYRKYLKVWAGPIDGMKIDAYLNNRETTSEAEARRIEKFIKSRPGVKRLTIPCDYAGAKYRNYVYITDVPWPKDPLEDQARYLWEERSVRIPQTVRAAVRRLHKIAHDNKVSFQDLVVYALAKAAEEAGQKLIIENIK